MKLQKVSFPNGDITEIHLNKSVLKFAFDPDNDLSTMGVRKGDPALGKRLLRIKGITEVDIAGQKECKYVIRLTKGRLFDWSTIHKKAIKIIHEVVAPKEKLEILTDSYES